MLRRKSRRRKLGANSLGVEVITQSCAICRVVPAVVATLPTASMLGLHKGVIWIFHKYYKLPTKQGITCPDGPKEERKRKNFVKKNKTSAAALLHYVYKVVS